MDGPWAYGAGFVMTVNSALSLWKDGAHAETRPYAGPTTLRHGELPWTRLAILFECLYIGHSFYCDPIDSGPRQLAAKACLLLRLEYMEPEKSLDLSKTIFNDWQCAFFFTNSGTKSI